ncbi:MAG TPA: septal ring lytic transglycosylase RlpA family protein [Chromatiales bacterium]|nr:septal ring lytic transglycosylase RlpA family protein [Chromatiales bacterium]
MSEAKGRRAGHRRLFGCAALLLLGGCGTLPHGGDGGPGRDVDVSAIPDAVPRVEPRSPYGNPSSYFVRGRRYHVLRSSRGFVQRGIASWYGTKFHGRRTAGGEPYDMYAMTAAHRTLPIPTFVRVTNLRNGRSVIVRINDRGPFARNRVLDLSWAAAAKLGMLPRGTAPVKIRAIDPRRPGARPSPVVAAGHAPAPALARPAPPHAPAPKPAPERTAPRRVYVQAGAFVELDNAERLRDRLLRARVHAVRISPADRDAGRVYRVRIGPLAGVPAARRMVHTLEHLGVSGPRLVPN